MVVDFAAIDFNKPQMLILKNLDGEYLQPLAYAHNIQASIRYNEVSELTFELPAYVDGKKTPHYDDVVGMRMVEWVGIGQFILVNPTQKDDGVREVKECKAYSLEYEFTYKTTYIPDGTYNFWNPVTPDSTILGMILEDMAGIPLSEQNESSNGKAWKVGSVDSSLVGKYRTFENDGSNCYDFMKNTLQDSYQCIFDFDTMNRLVNVRSVSSHVAESQVYLSTENLVKEIEISEDTENIFTCLDVNGADGVDIMSVNPLGNNKIYNFDYFMSNGYFPSEMLWKWNAWKAHYESVQQQYFDLTVDKVLQESYLETEKAALVELKNQKKVKEEMQAAYVQAASTGSNYASQLQSIKSEIHDLDVAINNSENSLDGIQEQIDSLSEELLTIVKGCEFAKFFDDDEVALLQMHTKESAISESSFAYAEYDSYATPGNTIAAEAFNLQVTKSTVERVGSKYNILGGKLDFGGTSYDVNADIVRGNIDVLQDGTFLLSVYLGRGYQGTTKFTSASLSVKWKSDDGSVITAGSQTDEFGVHTYERLQVRASVGDAHFTTSPTEYSRRSVEWDLFEYGRAQLESLAYPAYTFSVDACNFLAASDFNLFKQQLALGRKVYVNIDGKILKPIVVGADINMEKPEDFKLLFGDKYSLKDSAFDLVDLLEESVSMGKTVAANKFNYNSFINSGASTRVQEYMTSALDAANQSVLAGKDQAITIDGSGIRLRKTNENTGAFDDHQVWMINNQIVFTDDGWNSASLAIGEIDDPNGSGKLYGVVGDALVGKLIAGENLIIESEQHDGDKALFKVDGYGAQMRNGSFDLFTDIGNDGFGQISLYPHVGLIGGATKQFEDLYAYDDGDICGVKTVSGATMSDLSTLDKDDLPLPNFWVDMKGNAYFKGTVYAEDGRFRGTVYATDGEFTGTVHATNGEFTGTIDAQTFKLNGVDLKNVFSATGNASTGALTGLDIGNLHIDSTGKITFSESPDGIKAIDETTVEYATSTSGTRAPTTGWRTTIPSVGQGEYLWTRTTISYTDGSPDTVSYSVSYAGEDGDAGEELPAYIKTTQIDFSQVSTPRLKANGVETLGAFKVCTGNWTERGYMGAARGMSASGSTTYGIAIADSATYDSTNGYITYDTDGHYMIVTNAGVRMQAGTHNITVTNNGCFADGNPIGSAGTAVWG